MKGIRSACTGTLGENLMNSRYRLSVKHILAVLLLAVIPVLNGCNSKNQQVSIAVFIPGIISDSPVYSMLASGTRTAVNEYNADKTDDRKALIAFFEAGTNQAEWGNKITALAASGRYSVIISSNPSMPEIIKPVTGQFPQQKFILLDAFEEKNPAVATICYNQREQSFLSGYIAALMSKTHKIGLIAAQQYPVMDNIILPGYIEGAKTAYPDTGSDYRIVGNWYDASKGAELAHAMFNAGVDVILPVCGGAAQGVISAANELGFYIAWFDNNGFNKAPGRIISSTVLRQDKMSQEITTEFLNGKTVWGTAKTVGIKEGYVEFIQTDPLYISTVPEPVRKKIAMVIESIRQGTLELPQQ